MRASSSPRRCSHHLPSHWPPAHARLPIPTTATALRQRRMPSGRRARGRQASVRDTLPAALVYFFSHHFHLLFSLFLVHLCYSQSPIPSQQHTHSSITSAIVARETVILTVTALHPPHRYNPQKTKEKFPTPPAHLLKAPPSSVQTCRPPRLSLPNPPLPLASKSSRTPKPSGTPSPLMAPC